MKKKILFPTDFSENADQAVRYVLQLYAKHTEEFGLQAVFVHVDTPASTIQPDAGVYVSRATMTEGGTRIKKQKLSSITSKWNKEFPLVSFQEILETGAIAPTIREVATDAKADLIAMGASGLGPIGRAILGSTAGSLSQKAPCPVLIIPQGASLRTPEKIIFATDFKNLADVHILDPLKEVASGFKSDLMLLHIYKDEKSLVDENVELVDELSEYFEIDKFDYYFLEDDDTLKGIEDFISGYRADMLTVVSQERNFFDGLFHSSLTKKLIVHSEIPLLVLHPIFWGSDDDDKETFQQKTKRQIAAWRSDVDRIKVQGRLGQMEASQTLDKGKDQAKKKLEEVKLKLDSAGDVTRDKWHHFQKEMSQALTHIRRALLG